MASLKTKHMSAASLHLDLSFRISPLCAHACRTQGLIDGESVLRHEHTLPTTCTPARGYKRSTYQHALSGSLKPGHLGCSLHFRALDVPVEALTNTGVLVYEYALRPVRPIPRAAWHACIGSVPTGPHHPFVRMSSVISCPAYSIHQRGVRFIKQECCSVPLTSSHGVIIQINEHACIICTKQAFAAQQQDTHICPSTYACQPVKIYRVPAETTCKPATSGWYIFCSCLYALRISAGEASISTPSSW